jgi:hypothetical protein
MTRENQIGPARQASTSQPVTKSRSMQCMTDYQLKLRILTAYP